jgi:protein O-GlcNAc transferase
VDPQRLALTPPLPAHAHLSGKAVADLFLDTPSFNAHSTLADALHAGLPAISLPVEKMAARVASSILIAAGLAYMVVRDSSEYEAIAARLLMHPPALARWRRAVSAGSPRIFDIKRWMRGWEALLSLLYGQGGGGGGGGGEGGMHVIVA